MPDVLSPQVLIDCIICLEISGVRPVEKNLFSTWRRLTLADTHKKEHLFEVFFLGNNVYWCSLWPRGGTF